MLLRKALLLSGATVLLLLLTASSVSADGDENGDKEEGEGDRVGESLIERFRNWGRDRSTTHRVTSTTRQPTYTTHRVTSTTHRPASTTHRPASTTHRTTLTTHRVTPTTTRSTHRATSAPTTTMTTRRPRRTHSTRSPSIHTTTYDYPHEPHDPSKNHHDKGYGRYDDDSDEYGGYYGDRSGEYDRSREIGRDGQHPGEYGQDYADFGPVYGRQQSMEASMFVWIRAADDWEQRGESRYRNQNNGRYGARYNQQRERDGRYKNRNDRYDDNENNYGRGNDYRKGDRQKRSHSRVKFPVRHFKDIKSFSRMKFPPLISIFPWLPIFYDRVTYQTFIFSPTGGIYILPPLINFYGQRFAVAQLIKWGYASLVSSGAPPPPSVDVAPFVQPVPAGPAAGGPVAGGAGAAAAPGGSAPTYDTRKNRFNGGVRTEFPDFKPRYAEAFEETGYGNNRGANRNTYGTDSNYGGTGRQEVYEQGGARAGGSAGGSVRGSGGYNY